MFSLERRRAHGRRSLRQNVFSALAGNAAYAAAQFGMLSALAHFTNVRQVGEYAFALAVTGPPFTFAYLMLRQVLATDATREFPFATYVAQRVVFTSVVSAALLLGTFPLSPDADQYLVFCGVVAFKALESVIDIFYGLMQRRHALNLVARSQMWRGLGGVAIFASFAFLSQEAAVAVFALAGYNLTQVFAVVWRSRQLGEGLRPVVRGHQLLALTKQALPLGFAASVAVLSINIPRYFLQASWGAAALGVFASLAYVLTAAGTLVNAMTQAASPRMADEFRIGDHYNFTRTLRRLLGIAAALGLGGIALAVVAGRPLLRFGFGAEYAVEAKSLVILMLAAAVQYIGTFLGTCLNVVRLFKYQLLVSLSSCLGILGFSALLVPTWGIPGAAGAVVAGQVLSLSIYVVLYQRAVKPVLEARAAS